MYGIYASKAVLTRRSQRMLEPKSKMKIACGMLAGTILCCAALTGCGNSSDSPATDTNNTVNNAAVEYNDSDIAASGPGYQVTEQEVSDYISQYRKYIDCSDDVKWATLLDESNQSPADVRQSAIEYLALGKIIEQKANELGIEATDDEIAQIVNDAKTDAGLSGNDSGWKSLLKATGYTEDGYSTDAKRTVLSRKICEQEVTFTEPSDAQIQAYGNTAPGRYLGKEVIIVTFPSSARVAANALADSSHGISEQDFREAAANSADANGNVTVADAVWDCLIETTFVYDNAISGIVPGNAVAFQDDDGNYKVAFVVAEYILPYNGRLDMTTMPDEIYAALKSDAAMYHRELARNNYLDSLLDVSALTISDMPANAPYNVDMTLSTYGDESTTSENENAMNEMISNQIAELEATAKNKNNE